MENKKMTGTAVYCKRRCAIYGSTHLNKCGWMSETEDLPMSIKSVCFLKTQMSNTHDFNIRHCLICLSCLPEV